MPFVKRTFLLPVLAVMAGLGLTACEPTPQEAADQIIDRGFTYDADGFVKAMDVDDMSVKLRFLIADPDNSLRNSTLRWMAGCEHRPIERNEDCINDIIWLTGRGADIMSEDKLGQSALHFAVNNGQLEIVQYLLKQGLLVKNQQLVQTAIARMNREMSIAKRDRLEEVARALTIQWMAESGQALPQQRGGGVMSANPFLKQ